MFAKRFLARRSVLALASLLLVPAGAVLSIRAFADDEASAGPTCCAKKAYCCTVKARCCDNDKTVETEIIPLSFVSDEAAQPTCCDKRAYCCTVKMPCCGKTMLMEIAYTGSDGSVADAEDVASNTCCAKRAYCCKIRSTCCGKEATADLEERDLTEVELVSFAADRYESKPTCCAKKAYCCKIKSPCCGKEFDIEAMR
ncbi:hypothetical protein [Stieleria mannarensis]|uniref:hypothetical protein n=1 Tax=Stieleria mannarensis TaxID=2755585 RepID=UPI001600F84C|nr:hypothetical protein [Rhodopirellula sp. JC639]